MIKQVTDNIFRIQVEMPGSPLKNVNAYIIRDAGRNLLIDTGERNEQSRLSLLAGLEALGVRMEDTDIFLTHLHTDHIGLVPSIVSADTRVYMSRADISLKTGIYHSVTADSLLERMLGYGFPEESARQLAQSADAGIKADPFGDYIPTDEGDAFEYGGHRLKTIAVPGHTPGHMCLYDEENKILFLGDHVLFNITPNINSWGGDDLLGDYIKSLLKIRDCDARLLLPGHREVTGTLAGRVDEIIEHHGKRVRETEDVLDLYPGSTAYQIAGCMSWNIRHSGGWESFPAAQKPFAVGEVQAHLDYLLSRGLAESSTEHGVVRYRSKKLS